MQFRGEYFFLSNFYPCMVCYQGIAYPSAEHAFQAQKCQDDNCRRTIAAAETPAEAKKLGHLVQVTPDWQSRRVDEMHHIVRIKFQDNKELGQRLLQTGDEPLIEEAGWPDYFWGVHNGRGQNQLGRILMQVRQELKEAG